MVLLEGVEQAGRAARVAQGALRTRSGTSFVEGGSTSRMPWAVGRAFSISRRWPAAAMRHGARRGRSRTDSLLGLTCTSVDVGCPPGTRRENRLRSIPDHGRDAGAGGHQEQLARDRGRRHQLALGLLQLEHLAGPGAVHQVVGDHTTGDRLHGEAEVAVAGAGRWGRRDGAPQAYAVDVDPDPDVLPRHVARPRSRPGLTSTVADFRGLRRDRDDPALEPVAAAAQRGGRRRSTSSSLEGRGPPPPPRVGSAPRREMPAARPRTDRCAEIDAMCTESPISVSMIHDRWT